MMRAYSYIPGKSIPFSYPLILSIFTTSGWTWTFGSWTLRCGMKKAPDHLAWTRNYAAAGDTRILRDLNFDDAANGPTTAG